MSGSLLDTPRRFRPRDTNERGFSFYVAACFTINYVIGTGFLALPWAFNEAGIVLSLITLLLVAVASDMSKNMLLEAIAVADTLVKVRSAQGEPLLSGGRSIGSRVQENISLLPVQSTPSPASAAEDEEDDKFTSPHMMVGARHFEVTELCELLLGRVGRNIYLLAASIYLYGALWAYASVFSNALAAHVKLDFISSDEDVNYILYLCVFAVAVVPLTCMEMEEQIMTQVTLAALRGVLIVLILSTIGIALYHDDGSSFEDSDGIQGTQLVRIGNIFKLAPIAIYANIYHHSIPNLAKTLRDRTRLVELFSWVFVVVNLAYALIGVSIAVYFGNDTATSANIHWVKYIGGNQGWSDFASFFVVVFPALDVLSASPLNGITLGNNMCSAFTGERAEDVLGNSRTRLFWRLLAAVPPLIGAAFVRDLGVITDYAGTSGFLVAFMFPALLYLAAMKCAKKEIMVTPIEHEPTVLRRASSEISMEVGILPALHLPAKPADTH